MWELDYKESWATKNWCFWTVVLEKTLESPLDCKEIQPVHPKGDESWVFIGRTDAEAETPILWPPDGKNWLIWKDPDAGKDWRQEEKGTTEDEMVGCHHWLNEQWTWVWVNSGSWWWTGRPGMLQSMGLQRVRHNWATELYWKESFISLLNFFLKASHHRIKSKGIGHLSNVISNHSSQGQFHWSSAIPWIYLSSSSLRICCSCL